MASERKLLITVRRKSAMRRFWRELGALIRWGLQTRVYGDFQAPFAAGVLGHEGFSVAGRKRADEVELVFYVPMLGVYPNLDVSQLSQMRREMREAVADVANKHGYSCVYHRERKPSAFV